MPPSLSALLIAKDEEIDLPACLESLQGLAQEIVVVVDETTRDRTEEIARRFGCTAARRPFKGFAEQRREALKLCTKEWVFWIDCDERAGPELRARLPEALEGSECAGFRIRREIRFLGKTLRFGGLGSENVLRVFRREKARFVGAHIHESVELSGGAVRSLPPEWKILHEPYRDLGDYLEKLDRYTTLGARKRFESGARFHAADHLRLPWEFFSRTVLRLGILDGYQGLVWAGLSACHNWLKYVKLRELERAR